MQELLTNKTVEKLKYDLVREGLVSYEDLSKAEEFATQNSTNLGFALIKNNFIAEHKLLEFIEQKLKIPFVNLEDYSLDSKCLSYISEKDARKYRLIPLFEIESVLTVAMADPMDLFVINNIVNELELQIEPIVCSESSIIKAIDENYGCCSDVCVSESSFNWQDELLVENIDTQKIREIWNAIFVQAIAEKQNHLVFENTYQGLGINFGDNEKGLIPSLLIPRFVSELKLLANMDVNVFDLPQLGKYCFAIDNKLFSVVISSFPTAKGERFSIKIYEPPPKFEDFGLIDNDRDKISNALSSAGIIGVLGTAQSGKTLFAYSMLSSIKNKRILTIESKIKYELEGVCQSELNEDVGYNIDKALSHIDFQSYDVVYFDRVYWAKIDVLRHIVSSGKTVIAEFVCDNVDIELDCKVILSNKGQIIVK